MSISTNRRAIGWLMAANTVSGIAQGITMLSIPWYFAITNQTNLFSWLYFGVHVLMLLMAPVSGVWVDKYDRKKLFIWLFVFIGFIELAIASLGFATGSVHWLLVFSVFMLTFLSYTIHYPNLYALMQQISNPEQYGKLTSLLEIQGQFSTIIAGGLGAILLEGLDTGGQLLGFNIPLGWHVKAWSIEKIFVLDSITYFAAAICIYFIQFVYTKQNKIEDEDFILRLKTGFAFLKARPALMIFGIFSLSVFATLMVETNTLLAPYVKYVVEANASVFAFAELYYAVGALTAGLIIRWLFQRLSLPVSILWMTAITMIGYLVMAIYHQVWFLYLYSLFLGICNAGIRVQRMTYMFSVIPNDLMGRVGSIFTLSNLILRMTLIAIVSIPLFEVKIQTQFSFLVLFVFLMIGWFILYRNKEDLAHLIREERA